MTKNNDDVQRSHAFAEKAFKLIKANLTPAWPELYELWFTYAAGHNIKLNQAVNTIIKDKGSITAEELDALRLKYIDKGGIDKEIDAVGGQVSEQISEIMTMLQTASGTTSDYGKSLENASKDLSKASDQASLDVIIRKLAEVTEEVQESNKKLNDRLEASQSEITKLQKNLETARSESVTDQLTGLANRKHFDSSIEEALENAQENDEAFSLLMTDIDHFKSFNDTHGHQTGDQVLRLVAKALQQNIKGQDIACRYGGEEFCVILPNTSLKQAIAVGENIRKAVEEKKLVKKSTGENLGKVTTSVGVATWRKGDSAHSMIERSDKCLYAAKDDGRNCVKAENEIKEVSAA